MERKMRLEQLKQSNNELVKRTASMISKDKSEGIVQKIRDESKRYDFDLGKNIKRKETEENESRNKFEDKDDVGMES